VLLSAGPAAAAGGAFFIAGDTSQVVDHTIVVSISQTQQTLWDSMTVSGSPASYAWVMPVHGSVTVDVSSDALMRSLDSSSAVVVRPPVGCAATPSCAVLADAGSDTGDAGVVAVPAHPTAAPYSLVMLSTSTDPNALTDWLSTQGYDLPMNLEPMLTGYIVAGWDFIAIKVVPGAGVDAPQPIRITTPGAIGALPLRIMAAGAGPTLPTTLYVVAQGRMSPSASVSFTVDPAQLVWSASTQSSNYDALVAQGFADAGAGAWLVEEAAPFDGAAFSSAMVGLATSSPLTSGYADSMGNGAAQSATNDMAALVGTLSGSVWLTRLRTDLTAASLSTDLFLVADSSQTVVPRKLTAGCPVCDAGSPDAGPTRDAGTDAGAPDAGPDGDAGVEDGGTMMDAGTAQDGGTGITPPTKSGCGCAAGGDLALVTIAVLAARGRRRR
jgi:hypothetical protein